jgi:hypothetical protein
VRIYACIADWDRLREYQEHHGQDLSAAGDWYRRDSFTGWNDSVTFNDAIGDLFLDIRGSLPAGVARLLEQLLIAFCPRIAEESEFAPPQSPGIRHDAYYAALAPDEVKRRLELLDGVRLSDFFARVAQDLRKEQDEMIADQGEVVEFFFMWAAALGQAASKGWGLVVIIC